MRVAWPGGKGDPRRGARRQGAAGVGLRGEKEWRAPGRVRRKMKKSVDGVVREVVRVLLGAAAVEAGVSRSVEIRRLDYCGWRECHDNASSKLAA